MRLFIDSALADDWQAWLPSGLLYGVTTNPTLLKRAGLACELSVLSHLTAQALALGFVLDALRDTDMIVLWQMHQ